MILIIRLRRRWTSLFYPNVVYIQNPIIKDIIHSRGFKNYKYVGSRKVLLDVKQIRYNRNRAMRKCIKGIRKLMKLYEEILRGMIPPEELSASSIPDRVVPIDRNVYEIAMREAMQRLGIEII